LKSSAAQAVEQCDRIAEKCDEVPYDAIDFADSVREKARSIRSWIESSGRVTDRQQAALDNMESGLDRWLEERGDE
jgi:hypothetical protein